MDTNETYRTPGEAWQLLRDGHTDRALEAFRDDAEISDEAADDLRLTRALGEAVLAIVDGEDPAAGRAFDRAIKIAGRSGRHDDLTRVALTLLAAAIAQGDWVAAGTAADRILGLVGEDDFPGLARVARSTKWERLSGTKYDHAPVTDDRDPWLRAFRALYRLRQERSGSPDTWRERAWEVDRSTVATTPVSATGHR